MATTVADKIFQKPKVTLHFVGVEESCFQINKQLVISERNERIADPLRPHL
jgi:hypothetical protein